VPVIEIHLLEGYSDADKVRLSEGLTDAVRLVVPAPPEAVTVMIHEMRTADYMRGRKVRTPAPARPDPSGIVQQFLSDMQAGNLNAARAHLASEFTMHFPGSGVMYNLDALIRWAAPRYQSVMKTYAGFDVMQTNGDASIVYCRGMLSGVWPDGTTFDGIRFIDRFEITDGLLTRQDVWNDIAEMRATP
jgi:4-oxalocrotonate tautomerase family enzyme